jgi:hypothetical protein
LSHAAVSSFRRFRGTRPDLLRRRAPSGSSIEATPVAERQPVPTATRRPMASVSKAVQNHRRTRTKHRKRRLGQGSALRRRSIRQCVLVSRTGKPSAAPSCRKSYSLGGDQNFRWDKALEAAAAIEDEELSRKFSLRKDRHRRQSTDLLSQPGFSSPLQSTVMAGSRCLRKRRAALDRSPGISPVDYETGTLSEPAWPRCGFSI